MQEYLRSTEWFRRRDQWFTDELQRVGEIRCIICDKKGAKSRFELHHMDYRGVSRLEDGTWQPEEGHDDLVAAHPRCHEWIHKVLDRDRAPSSARDRRTANERVIRALRAKFTNALLRLAEEED